jgi:glutamine synthetase
MTLEALLSERRQASLDAILSHVQTSSVRLVRFLWCDTESIIRGKTTHVAKLSDRMNTGIGLVKGAYAVNILDQLQTETGLGATGEIRLVPDPDTFVILPYASQSAMMICDLMEVDRTPWALCPRSILKRQVQTAKEMGVTFQAAFEPEFMLGEFDEDNDFVPIDNSMCFSTDGMNRACAFINRFCHALESQGIEVEQYYPELGHGQHELSISHAPALAAADRHIIYRETLRGVATEMGLAAMLAPKPVADSAGNGCHLHLSAWDASSNENLFKSSGSELSEFGQQFVAGLIKHLPSLVALTAPSVNSYRRLKPKSWSSAYTCWGYENREAAVRVPTTYWGKEEESTNIELKSIDSSCNPYIALAAVIACGLDGVRNKLVPPNPVNIDPATMTTAQATKAGVKRLPATLKEALRKLENNEVLYEAIGEEFLNTFITVKESDVAAFAKHSVEYELIHHRTKF